MARAPRKTAAEVEVVDIMDEAALIPFPHAARQLVQADAFTIMAWLGNTKLPNWHRNVDVDELWIHFSGPPVEVFVWKQETPVVLGEGEMLLIPKGTPHTSAAPAEPAAVVAIVEKHIERYERHEIEAAFTADTGPNPDVVSWQEEIRRYTPPWRYPQVELIRADSFVVQLMVRAEGSLKPRETNEHGDEVWFVLKGRVQIALEVDGSGPTVPAGSVARVPAGVAYRAIALDPWTAAFLLRGRAR